MNTSTEPQHSWSTGGRERGGVMHDNKALMLNYVFYVIWGININLQMVIWQCTGMFKQNWKIQYQHDDKYFTTCCETGTQVNTRAVYSDWCKNIE